MTRTQIRASQFRINSITATQLADQAVTPEKVAGTPLNITSLNGLVSLPRVTNYFVVTGSEDVVNISGWNYGMVIIEWASDRLIMHLDGAIELPSSQNRKVIAGDVSTFVFKNGVAREIAVKLETAHTINDVAFDGTADIVISQINGKDIAIIDEIPTSLPANGGNSDTVGGLDVSDIITKCSLSAIPNGCITMWSGSITTIPTNWHLCDGTNGTPNLLDRMVVCAGKSYDMGAVGGEVTHTLTIAEMPSHNHYMNGWTNHASGGPAAPGAGPFEGGYYTNPTGGNQSHNNMPPYYSLAYIMKTS
jgi:hypothetical protein